jgi:hypothetical protein
MINPSLIGQQSQLKSPSPPARQRLLPQNVIAGSTIAGIAAAIVILKPYLYNAIYDRTRTIY